MVASSPSAIRVEAARGWLSEVAGFAHDRLGPECSVWCEYAGSNGKETRIVTVAPAHFGEHGHAASGGVVVRLQPALCPTDEQFYAFCRLNDELRIERDCRGEVSILPPTGWATGAMNAEITFQLQRWARADGTGRAVDSSAGYELPNGAMRSPDASWVSNERLARLTAEQRSRFLPLCPDFVVELRSPTDRPAALANKMTEYILCGTALGWLIDPARHTVVVYRPESDPEELHSPSTVSGDPLLPGFRLTLREVWREAE